MTDDSNVDGRNGYGGGGFDGKRRRQGGDDVGPMGRRKDRSRSRSIEDDITDQKQLLDHFRRKQEENTKTAEQDRSRTTRLIEIGKLLRQYDLNNIRTAELEQITLALHNLKTDWTQIKASQQEKMKYVQDVQTRHKKEIVNFEKFCEYLEPKSFQDKLRFQIRQIHTQESLLEKPVADLKKQRDYLLQQKKRKQDEVEDVEAKNALLRDRLSKDQRARETENEKNESYLSDQ